MSGGASSGSGNSVFRRQGTATTSSWRQLTGDQKDLFSTSFNAVSPGGANGMVDNFLQGRLSDGYQGVPHVEELCQLIRANMPSQPIIGGVNLQSMAERDPYSAAFDNNTYQRYSQELGKMLAGARSGPAMTMGGNASRGFAEAEVMNQAALNREDVLSMHRGREAQIAQGAANSLAGINQGRSQVALGGMGTAQGGYFNQLQNQMGAGSLASERVKMHNDLVPTFASLASTLNGKETNDLSGWGAQTSSSMGVGMNICCFIFLESYNGKLPWYVREYRDMFAPESSARRKGYIRMSKWLVPAMRVSGVSRWLTNHLLVKPLTCYGGWFFGQNKVGWVFKPVRNFWFKVWELYGRNK